MAKSEVQKALEAEYNRALKNLKRRVRTKQKQGYSVSESIIPKRPKVITEKSIESLNKRTGKYIAQRSVYTSHEGVIIKGATSLKQKRSKRSKRATETRKRYYLTQKEVDAYDISAPDDMLKSYESEEPTQKSYVVLQQLRDLIDSWSADARWSEELTGLKRQDKKLLENVLNAAISQEGEEVVAQRCDANAETIISIANSILYQSSGDSYRKNGRENAQFNIQKIGAILMGRGLTVSESIKFTSYADLQDDNELPV